MVQILTPRSVWIQIGSLFFTLAGVHGDLLVIRFFLCVAYFMFLLNAALGSPLIAKPASLESVSVDSLVWASLGLYINGSSLISLIMDEKRVHFTDDEAALWRMFYRTGGLSACLFKSIVSDHFKVVEFGPGDIIPTDCYFYIIYKGFVHLDVYEKKERKLHRTALSGEMFDIQYLGMFHQGSVFERSEIRCRSLTNTKLFQFSRDDIVEISHSPFVKGVLQALLINNLSFVVESYRSFVVEQQLISDNPARFSDHYCDKIFSPLADWEKPKNMLAGSGAALSNPLWHLMIYIYRSFALPWPVSGHPAGIRQTLLPSPAAGTQPTAISLETHSMRPAFSTGPSDECVTAEEVNDHCIQIIQ